MTRIGRIALDDWAPRGVDERADAFARSVVAQVDPPSWARARSLVWSASRLCAFALSCGHEPEPAVVLSGAMIERFIVTGTPRWSSAARRTVRSNVYFLARRVLVRAPEPVPLGRERAQAPYSDARPAHLSRVHAALIGLGEAERRRLGVVVNWKGSPHELTYRQIEYTLDRIKGVLKNEHPDGTPSTTLQGFVDALIEASIPTEHKEGSTALAVDWTDVESFARPPLEEGKPSADPEASWGHRRGNAPGQRDELFYGFYLGLATMVHEEVGAAVPELVRRMGLTSCHVDPVPAFVPVLENTVASGVALGDVLNDSGYAHRVPEHWALPLRALGAELVMDLHPGDRGTQGTFEGAVCCNGSLYCPSTPGGLFAIEPLARGASAEQTCAHDARSAELDRYRFAVVSSDDADGYHRVMCPAAAGKLRCPRRQPSMALSHTRPEILAPPEHPPVCCTQVTFTVPPSVNSKTRQKHPYPSAAHRRSYGRRSAAERANATIKDPASNDVASGWCRLMGLVPMTVMLACLIVVRNERVLASFAARQADNERRAAQGLAPRTRRRRRTTIADLVVAQSTAPP
jgi:hypothetical protein